MPENPNSLNSNSLDTSFPDSDPSGTGISADGSPNPLDQLDPLELLIDLNATSIPDNEPIVICIDGSASHEYLGIIETIGKRLYRERVGGTPDPLRITDVDELVDETRWVEAEDNVLTVALSESDWETLESEYKQEWTRIWSNRIQNQLFAQEFGVLIVNQRIASPPGDHFPRIYNINPSLPPTQVQQQVGAIASGFSGHKNSDCENFKTFSQKFNYWQEHRQRKVWTKIKMQRNGLFWDTTTPDSAESELHRRLKVFAVRALTSSLDINISAISGAYELRNYIRTERALSLSTGEEIRPDVVSDSLANGKTVAIEIETLFATDRSGGAARDKLRQTICKYKGDTTIDQLIILVDPFSVITHGTTLTSVAASVDSCQQLPKVTFASINFTTGSLQPVASIKQELEVLLNSDDPDLEDVPSGPQLSEVIDVFEHNHG